MYLLNVEIRKSEIEGKGVFSLEDIEKGSIVWRFDPRHDLSITQGDFEKLNLEKKEEIEKTGYLSPVSKKWIIPPKNDPAFFTNHSSSKNNLSAVYDSKISPEPFFIANKDIWKGEELIVNYLEFDEFIKKNKPQWI